jgi:hypothetical protein
MWSTYLVKVQLIINETNFGLLINFEMPFCPFSDLHFQYFKTTKSHINITVLPMTDFRLSLTPTVPSRMTCWIPHLRHLPTAVFHRAKHQSKWKNRCIYSLSIPKGCQFKSDPISLNETTIYGKKLEHSALLLQMVGCLFCSVKSWS